MKITIPTVLKSRERIPFKLTYEERSEHVPYFDDFCIACGTDLRIPRLIVDEVPAKAAMLFALAKSADRAQYSDCPSEQLEMVRLSISKEERVQLAELFYESLETDSTHLCGFDEAEPAGITEDGTFLYVRSRERCNGRGEPAVD